MTLDKPLKETSVQANLKYAIKNREHELGTQYITDSEIYRF